MSSVTKSVIPVAGLATRFQPATKALPKALLPVVDRPSIEYVVDEAARAGISDALLITSRGQSAIADHFDAAPELEQALQAKGDERRLQAVQATNDMARVHLVRQGEALGLGHAVLMAADHVGEEPFAVQLGDDLIDPRDEILPAMLQVQERLGGSVIALLEVPQEQVSSYGCAGIEAADPTAGFGEDVVRVRYMVEKPAPEDAPSNLAMIGRYVLGPGIFDALRNTPPGRGDEIQLTDALQNLAQGGQHPVHGVVFRGRRYDTGNPLDYLKTVVQLGGADPHLGADFRTWLSDYLSSER